MCLLLCLKEEYFLLGTPYIYLACPTSPLLVGRLDCTTFTTKRGGGGYSPFPSPIRPHSQSPPSLYGRVCFRLSGSLTSFL